MTDCNWHPNGHCTLCGQARPTRAPVDVRRNCPASPDSQAARAAEAAYRESLDAAGRATRHKMLLDAIRARHDLELHRPLAVALRAAERLHAGGACPKGCRDSIESMSTDLLYPDRWRVAWGPRPTLPDEIPSTAYITTERLTRDTLRLAAMLPSDLDAVVGIARSGLLAAVPVACYLHLPLYSVNGSVLDLGGGIRMETTPPERQPKPPAECRRVLICDDTMMRGRTTHRVRPVVERHFPQAEILTAVVYSSPQMFDRVDFCVGVYPGPHYLEWNLFNSGHVAGLMTDMDGILCDDIAPGDDDDGPRYSGAIRFARPKAENLPHRYPVQAVVTARLERYRAETEAWLKRHGVLYRELRMGPWKHPSERWRDNAAARWKAEHYRESQCWIFVESDPGQAKIIAAESGKPVLCPRLETVLSAQEGLVV